MDRPTPSLESVPRSGSRGAAAAAPPTVDPAPAVEHLARHLGPAREGADPEGVHQLRVACRRLMVWLQMARRQALRADLRWMREAAAEVRDLDVLIARSLPEEFRAWLVDERGRAQGRLRRELDSTRAEGLLEALRWLRPIPIEAAERELARLRRLAAERGEALARPAADVHEERARLHDLRRALRRLRYTLGWAGQDQRGLRRLQAALGGLNDLELLHAALGRYPHPERVVELTADVEARAGASHRACLAAWDAAREVVRGLHIARG